VLKASRLPVRPTRIKKTVIARPAQRWMKTKTCRTICMTPRIGDIGRLSFQTSCGLCVLRVFVVEFHHKDAKEHKGVQTATRSICGDDWKSVVRPIEVIVEAGANEIAAEAQARRRRIGVARRPRRVVEPGYDGVRRRRPEVKKDIFQLGAPSRREHPFQAA